jgi:hypothetical protein
MTVEEAREMIRKVDAAKAAGVEFNEEVMLALGYAKTEGGVWELPIPVEILKLA